MSPPEPGPAIAPGTGRRGFPTIKSPYFALVALFSMNLLNYVDRYVFFSSGPAISKELHYSDTQFGYLSVSFMVVYTIVSPLMGVLGDRYSRRKLLAFGVALWSVATVGTAFAGGFYDMFFWRALLGIGEASYGIIAPALLSDLFAPRYRGRVMGLYFLALPIGGAIGSGIGGYFSHHIGWFSDHTDWRLGFWVVGIPGLIASMAAFLMYDPGRGASEGKATGKDDRPTLADYLSIFRTPTFVYNTAGLAAVTFALGAYAVWAVTFYHRVRGMDVDKAGIWIGVLTAIAGLLGISLGTVAADFLARFTRRAYLIWAAVAVAIAVPCIVGTILEPDLRTSLGYLFGASIMMASVLGPSNTVTANVVPANRRAAGYALCIFLVHLFGDISSPLLISYVSELFGKPLVAASRVGLWLDSIGARPTDSPAGPSNLTAGMLAVVPMLALGSVFFLRGSKDLPADQEKARLAGGDPLGEPLLH
jgi:predicted MFS family arabinose efflux permease